MGTELGRSQGSSVSIVTMLQGGQQRTIFSIAGTCKTFLSSRQRSDHHRGPSSPPSDGYRALFLQEQSSVKQRFFTTINFEVPK